MLIRIFLTSVTVLLMTTSSTVNGINCFGMWSRYQTDLCNVTTDSSWQIVEYNCSQVCCGGKLYPRDDGSACCGNEKRGHMFNHQNQICCSWWYTGHYKIYEKENKGEHCCGVHLFKPDTYSNGTNCCRGWKSLPTPFNSRTEMCCQGYKTYVGDTSFGKCCGLEGYDARNSSCPCWGGRVAKGLKDDEVECCYGNDYRSRSPYAPKTQGCCDGAAYELESEFCCDGLVGNSSTHVCCDGKQFSRNPEKSGSKLGCCTLSDGRSVQYNVETETCCNGTIAEQPSGTKGICCGDQLSFVSSRGSFGCCVDYESGNAEVYDETRSVCCEGVVGVGDACCEKTAYVEEGHVCCEGQVGTGDSCCGEKHFIHGSKICCDGHLGEETYTQPACCGNRSFDSFTHTCCGSRVLDNPLVPSGYEDIFYVSHTTRCCGNFTEPLTLFPYDYNSSICCNGVINDVGEIEIGEFECCGTKAMRRKSEICCGGGTAVSRELLTDEIDQTSLCEQVLEDLEYVY